MSYVLELLSKWSVPERDSCLNFSSAWGREADSLGESCLRIITTTERVSLSGCLPSFRCLKHKHVQSVGGVAVYVGDRDHYQQLALRLWGPP